MMLINTFVTIGILLVAILVIRWLVVPALFLLLLEVVLLGTRFRKIP